MISTWLRASPLAAQASRTFGPRVESSNGNDRPADVTAAAISQREGAPVARLRLTTTPAAPVRAGRASRHSVGSRPCSWPDTAARAVLARLTRPTSKMTAAAHETGPSSPGSRLKAVASSQPPSRSKVAGSPRESTPSATNAAASPTKGVRPRMADTPPHVIRIAAPYLSVADPCAGRRIGGPPAGERSRPSGRLITMTYTLVLLRHGESEWNALNLFTGWVDVDLSDKGREEASQGGRLLREAGVTPDVLHTSVLRRAIRTSQLALDAADLMWLPVKRSWRLNERHYGALQGKDKAATLEAYGEEQFMLWRRSYDVPPPPLDPADSM